MCGLPSTVCLGSGGIGVLLWQISTLGNPVKDFKETKSRVALNNKWSGHYTTQDVQVTLPVSGIT